VNRLPSVNGRRLPGEALLIEFYSGLLHLIDDVMALMPIFEILTILGEIGKRFCLSKTWYPSI
jgi:hypothetical protein